MAGISDEVREQIRDAAGIEAVAAELTRLRPAGIGRLKGLCPLHDEKTPSFTVNTAAGLWHCFGCGEGGDVYALVMKTAGMTFPESARHLADRFGVNIPDGDDGPDAARRAAHQSAARKMLDQAETLYGRWLLADDQSAAAARQWLSQRRFGRAEAEQWGIGFAPPTGSALARAVGDVDRDVANLTGPLLVHRDSGWRDRMRNRLVWPIRDGHGRLVGFAGRAVGDLVDGRWSDGGGKYINPADGSLYNKSRTLFGLDRARRAILRTRTAVVCEGYTDVMAFHAAGVDTAVAACGTAFTRHHADELIRLVGDGGEVITAYDPDPAGWEATWRTFLALQDAGGVRHTVVPLPPGADPCDMWSQHGGPSLVAAVEARQPVVQLALQRIADRHDTSDPEQAATAAREATTLLKQVTDPALRSGYARKAASMLSVPDSAVAPGKAGLVPRAEQGTDTTPAALQPFSRAQLSLLRLIVVDPQARAAVADQLGAYGLFPPQADPVLAAVAAADPAKPAWATLTESDDTRPVAAALAVVDLGPADTDAGRALLAVQVAALDNEVRELRGMLNDIDPGDVDAVSRTSAAIADMVLERREKRRLLGRGI